MVVKTPGTTGLMLDNMKEKPLILTFNNTFRLPVQLLRYVVYLIKIQLKFGHALIAVNCPLLELESIQLFAYQSSRG